MTKFLSILKSKGAILTAGCFLIIFYLLFDPVENIWMPQCLFHRVTGLQCMGCGSQRMVHALLHGELRDAFFANAFLFCSIPLFLFLGWVELNRKKHPRLYTRMHSLNIIIGYSVLLAIWFIGRNLIGM